MFSYCSNNPVVRYDMSGRMHERIKVEACGGYINIGIAGGGAGTLFLLEWLKALFSFPKSKSPNDNSNKNEGKSGNNGNHGQQPEPPDVTYPGDDPTKAPDGYEWTGPDPQGGERGGYKNPNGKDSWHQDLNHPDGIDPHWDYNDMYGHKWRVFPDRIEFVK